MLRQMHVSHSCFTDTYVPLVVFCSIDQRSSDRNNIQIGSVFGSQMHVNVIKWGQASFFIEMIAEGILSVLNRFEFNGMLRIFSVMY